MIFIAKKKLILIAENLHLRIFGHSMSDVMRDFLGHLSWSFLGGIIASGIVFVVNILAGRILGPEEYGKYGLVIAISSVFIIPMTLGIETASTHYIAKYDKIEDKKRYLNSALLISVPLIFFITFCLLFFSDFLSNLFNTVNSVVITSILFGTILSLKNILDSFLKGFHLFRFQSVIRILEASIIFLVFVLFIYRFSFISFYAYLGSIALGYLFFILMILIRIGKYFSFILIHRKKIISYSLFVVIGAISGILLNSFDKILINKYIGAEQLGIYNAYSIVSVIIVSQILTIFVNVFFPFLSSVGDKSQFLAKLNKVSKIIFFPTFILLILALSCITFLFGDKYPFDLILIIEFGLLAALTAYFTALWWLIASKGRRGMQFTSFNGIIAGLIFIGLSLLFRNNLNLHSIVLFLIVGVLYAVLIGNLKYGKIK